MKKEKSVMSVVSTHIITTSIIIPFFGLLAGYFINKFLSASLNHNSMVMLRDIVYIIFFYIGVKYSLSYIDNKIYVKNPQNSLIYSIIIFGLIIISVLIFEILAQPDIVNIGYSIAFFGIIFLIFFLLTKNYFKKLQQNM